MQALVRTIGGALVGGLLVLIPQVSAMAAGDPFAEEVPLYLVLDTSGSMRDGEPVTKLDAAKKALYALIRDLPSQQQVTLVSYPSGSHRIEGCNAGQVRSVSRGWDRTPTAAAVRGLTADGETPTGPTLLHVRDLFLQSGHRKGVVVLVSDGEANCGETDVCQVARTLSADGLALTVNTVRLNISAEGAEQLRCIADATGGISVAADEAGALLDGISAAARGALELDIAVPGSLQTVTGTSAAAANEMKVSVRAVGAQTSRDVRVLLRLRDGSDRDGQVYVPNPVRFLGNITSGQSREIIFVPRPVTGTVGPIAYELIVQSENSATVVRDGSMTLVDSSDRGTAGPLLTEARHVVVMGDSYSSGEGAGDYEGADDYRSQLWACHRSSRHYGRQLFDSMAPPEGGARQVSLLACSGAEARHLYRYQYIAGIEPQLTRLNDLAKGDDPPDLVMLTVGGNDVGFKDFIIGCVMNGWFWQPIKEEPPNYRPCGRDATEPLSATLTEQTQVDLYRAYSAIDSVLNRDEVVQKRDGRIAQVVVLPYVNPLPPIERLRAGCFLGLSVTEAYTAQRFLNALNTTVGDAVAESGSGVPIHLASPVVDAVQDGHTICDEAPAIRVDGVASKWAGEEKPIVADDGFRRVQELMHPDEVGHRLIADVLVEWSRSVSVDWTSGYRAADQDVSVERTYQATFRQVMGSVDFPRLPEPGDDVALFCDDMFTSLQCEEVTRTKVGWITLYSVPTPLAVVEPASSDGGWPVSLPETLAPGQHDVVFEGISDSGEAVYAVGQIVIRPVGTRTSLAMTVAGFIVMAVGFVLWRHRLRAADQPTRRPRVRRYGSPRRSKDRKPTPSSR